MIACPHCGRPLSDKIIVPYDEYEPDLFCYHPGQCALDHAPRPQYPLPDPYWQENGSCCPWLVVDVCDDVNGDRVLRQDSYGRWWEVVEATTRLDLIVPEGAP